MINATIEFVRQGNREDHKILGEGSLIQDWSPYQELPFNDYQSNPIIYLQVEYYADEVVRDDVVVQVRDRNNDAPIPTNLRFPFYTPTIHTCEAIPFEGPGIYEFEIYANGKRCGHKSLTLT